MNKASVTLILAVVCGHSFGQAPTLQDLDNQERAYKERQRSEQTVRQVGELSAMINKMAQDFQFACGRSIGARSFCKCIGENIPAIFGFVDYVKITAQTKAANNYAALDKDTQRAYDKVGAVRDMCVANESWK